MSTDKTKETEKILAGRPTTYTPQIGVQILELMEQGLSLFAACGDLDINRSTVYLWQENNHEFKELMELAKQKRQSFLEKRLMNDAATGPMATSTIFALKNASADWREDTKQQLEVSGPGGQPLFNQITFAVIDSREPELKTIEHEAED